ncbi:phytoene desaturase family protein [Leptothoe spongobia]|uniref:NAD(P)/FAD-dependent oxidoreductase n=1 Tax=Leptothoe spongobia TAU-MAC 1115 TaxID=1967444 RepID=A0A947DHU6_9CYAN|nr:NAD(P)/FAD-dependent oxidoreductase [Leptothoe spongobia]MBT9317255.1 NAD(P)/FAD-dependent oxidoreductase [Leptothoe spongobia TAU-MAC 1115]
MGQTEIVVIGSGLGGLCCAALLARYGYDVVVCESHSIAGGAAHGFERGGFLFDSGPSLYSGLSYSPSPNPLRQVLDAIGEDANWINYDTWGCCLPEGDFKTMVGAEQFCDVLHTLRGTGAVQEWRDLQRVMQPLGAAAIALPPAAMRFDLGAFQTVGHFLPALLRQAPQVAKLTGPFSHIMDGVVHDDFARNWLDMLCFLLSGLPADGTIAAEVAFMFADWYRPGVQLDYPKGGSASLVAALVRGMQKYGGELKLNAHIEEILLDGDRSVGVRLRHGETIMASKAVISNASIWDTLKLLPSLPSRLQRFVEKRQATPECDSFMHLHLGIDVTGLEDLACHYIVVNDWSQGINAPQNLVLISIPSVLDPGLAPVGKHTSHVYTPGNEPYGVWAGLDRRSDDYGQLKQRRAEVMWQALERVIPDVRSRCDITMVGTPLTHGRFLRRHHGSYGPAIRAGQGVFPGPQTPVENLWCCGDSTFPGIGLPAVAASGMVLANTLAPVRKHKAMLREIGVLNI